MRYMEVARRNKHLSQHQLARLCRVDQVFVSMIERGVAMPTPDQAARFSGALGVPAEILGDEVPIAALDDVAS